MIRLRGIAAAGAAWLMLAGLLGQSPAMAQDQKASRGTYLKLMEVQELWEEERYDEARVELQALSRKVRGKAYDHAAVNQYLAHTSILAGDAGRARDALETALSNERELPSEMVAELKLFYGQVMLGEEEYQVARDAFAYWLEHTVERVRPNHLFSAAYAYYRTGVLDRAEELVTAAIDAVETPNDNWDRLYYQILFEQERYAEAEAIILRLVSRQPDDRQRWNMLANHYLRMEDSVRALAVMLVTYQRGLMEDAEDLSKIVSMYSYVDVPERAARLLQEWMEAGVIEQTPDTLRQLGDLLMMARERKRAKSALEQAAAVAPDGHTWELLASLHFEDENWSAAYEAYQRALESGGLEEPDRVSLLAGMSAMNAGMPQKARVALERAARSENLRAQAERLLERLDDV